LIGRLNRIRFVLVFVLNKTNNSLFWCDRKKKKISSQYRLKKMIHFLSRFQWSILILVNSVIDKRIANKQKLLYKMLNVQYMRYRRYYSITINKKSKFVRQKTLFLCVCIELFRKKGKNGETFDHLNSRAFWKRLRRKRIAIAYSRYHITLFDWI
jgi:hypothetical protein